MTPIESIAIVRDTFDWLVVWATLGSSVVAVLALVMAAAAIRLARGAESRARLAVLNERRINLELDVLRDLADALDDTNKGAESQLYELARRLPTKWAIVIGDLPFWRFMSDYQDLQRVADELRRRDPGVNLTQMRWHTYTIMKDEIIAATNKRVGHASSQVIPRAVDRSGRQQPKGRMMAESSDP